MAAAATIIDFITKFSLCWRAYRLGSFYWSHRVKHAEARAIPVNAARPETSRAALFRLKNEGVSHPGICVSRGAAIRLATSPIAPSMTSTDAACTNGGGFAYNFGIASSIDVDSMPVTLGCSADLHPFPQLVAIVTLP
jgi:hypothetical protein